MELGFKVAHFIMVTDRDFSHAWLAGIAIIRLLWLANEKKGMARLRGSAISSDILATFHGSLTAIIFQLFLSECIPSQLDLTMSVKHY